MLPDQFLDVEPLDAGGFGAVWSATAPGGERVAIKSPKKLNARSRARFVREVRLQSGLDHPNITPILDFDLGSTEPWCAMPLADGNLGHYVSDASVSTDSILTALRETVAGVEFAHDKHVLHRDLKPANVLMFKQSGVTVARVADFGLSRRFTRDNGTFQTSTGQGFITEWYSAPEQWTGFREVGVTADIFSLGRIIEYVLSKREDFRATYSGLQRCVAQATREEPDERYQSTRQLLNAIDLTASAPNSLLRPIDQTRSAAERAAAHPDDPHVLFDLILLLEHHSTTPSLLQSMITLLPYELVTRLGEEFPGQFRTVMRSYSQSLVDSASITVALRGVSLLDHCLVELKDTSMRSMAIVTLARLAAAYDMGEFTTPALGWLHSIRDADVAAQVALDLVRHPETIDWLHLEASQDRLPEALRELVFVG